MWRFNFCCRLKHKFLLTSQFLWEVRSISGSVCLCHFYGCSSPVTLLQTYSLARGRPCETESHRTKADLFRKGSVLTLTQISCRSAKHRWRKKRVESPHYPQEHFSVSLRIVVLLVFHFLHPSSFRTFFFKVRPKRCLPSVCLCVTALPKTNWSAQSLSARRRAAAFLCVWIGRACICSIQWNHILLWINCYSFVTVTNKSHCATQSLQPPSFVLPPLFVCPAATSRPSFLSSLTFVQGYSFSSWLETFLK